MVNRFRGWMESLSSRGGARVIAIRMTRRRARLTAGSILIVTGATSTVLAAPPQAIATYSIDSGATATLVIDGVQNGSLVNYDATVVAPDGSWKLVYDLSADLAPNPSASLLGSVTVTNLGSSTRIFRSSVNAPLCPMILGGSAFGGLVTVVLTSQGPGSIACGDAPELVRVLMNNAAVRQVFQCPFSIATTGDGSMSSFATFGLPGPNLPGPMTAATIGQAYCLRLTPLDTASIQFTYLFKQSQADAVGCAGDIDGDGVVDSADMAYLLTQWELVTPCNEGLTADLDGSGVVNAADLTILLGSWGACNSVS